jgi:NADH-quinone oxidoreductase subunit A
MVEEFVPILIQILIAVGFSAVALIASVVLGRAGRRSKIKDTPYECGMLPQGGAQSRFSVKFYLVAMLFILFDIEVVFMYPWAVVYREYLSESGGLIFWSMLSFVAILTVGYVYALKKGVFNWRSKA